MTTLHTDQTFTCNVSTSNYIKLYISQTTKPPSCFKSERERERIIAIHKSNYIFEPETLKRYRSANFVLFLSLVYLAFHVNIFSTPISFMITFPFPVQLKVKSSHIKSKNIHKATNTLYTQKYTLHTKINQRITFNGEQKLT